MSDCEYRSTIRDYSPETLPLLDTVRQTPTMPSQPAETIMPPELIEPLEALIFQAVALTVTAIAAVDASELTIPKWRTIVILSEHGSCTITELATALRMSMPSTSRMVQRLRDRGHVETNRTGRTMNVRLSTQGQTLRDSVVHARRQLLAQAINNPIPNELVPGIQAITVAIRESQGTDPVSADPATLTLSRRDGGA